VYIGAHKGFENDGYVCSSETMLKEYSIRQSDFSREILYRGTWKECLRFEQALIRGLIKSGSNIFYNKSCGAAVIFTDDVRRKMSIASRNRRRTAEHGAAIGRAQLGNKRALGKKGPLGYKHTEETKQKMKEKRKGKTPSAGYKPTEDHVRKMYEGRMRKKLEKIYDTIK